MYRGHAGLSLMLCSILSLLLKPLGVDKTYVLVTCLLMVALSFLPDLDMRFRKYGIKHRGVTHTFLFGAVIGVLFALVIGYGFGYGSLGWLMGFVAGFGGTASHILGDALTHSPYEGAPFRPFYPFSSRELAYGFFRASDKMANNVMLVLGILAFSIFYALWLAPVWKRDLLLHSWQEESEMVTRVRQGLPQFIKVEAGWTKVLGKSVGVWKDIKRARIERVGYRSQSKHWVPLVVGFVLRRQYDR